MSEKAIGYSDCNCLFDCKSDGGGLVRRAVVDGVDGRGKGVCHRGCVCL